eukprot:4952539-Pyramimonas_sp.AAC.1
MVAGLSFVLVGTLGRLSFVDAGYRHGAGGRRCGHRVTARLHRAGCRPGACVHRDGHRNTARLRTAGRRSCTRGRHGGH